MDFATLSRNFSTRHYDDLRSLTCRRWILQGIGGGVEDLHSSPVKDVCLPFQVVQSACDQPRHPDGLGCVGIHRAFQIELLIIKKETSSPVLGEMGHCRVYQLFLGSRKAFHAAMSSAGSNLYPGTLCFFLFNLLASHLKSMQNCERRVAINNLLCYTVSVHD